MALSFRPLDLVLLTFPQKTPDASNACSLSSSASIPTVTHVIQFAKSFQATGGLETYLHQLERALRDITRLQHVVHDDSWPHTSTLQCLEVCSNSLLNRYSTLPYTLTLLRYAMFLSLPLYLPLQVMCEAYLCLRESVTDIMIYHDGRVAQHQKDELLEVGGTLSCALASACFVSPFHPASYTTRLLEQP
jgi:hypothetical protein